MAKLYLLRRGIGDGRVASSFEVSVERVKGLYGGVRVSSSDRLPTINSGLVNPVSDPAFAVIELYKGDDAFGDFRSPGFNIILDVDPMDCYKRLVEE